MDNVKRAQVIILPTENKTYIGKHLEDEVYLSLYTWYLKTLNIPNKRQGQHLYIISDDEIKEGDWFINLFNNVVVQAHNWIYVSTCKKIIATTDTSLKINNITRQLENDAPNIISLPQPSQQFIEKYIESYNNGEVITNVLVDYKTNILYPMIENNNLILKVNTKDNTITIKKLKDNWNLEEIKSILLQFAKDCNENEDLIRYYNRDYKNLNNWIQKNL